MIVIYCKGCGALFYAVNQITSDDVLEIVNYARQGHHVAKTNSATTQLCTCGAEKGKRNPGPAVYCRMCGSWDASPGEDEDYGECSRYGIFCTGGHEACPEWVEKGKRPPDGA